MAVEIGYLRALLSLDSAAFEKGAKRAQASMGRMQKRLEKASERMRRQFMGVSAAAGAMGAGLSLAINSGLRDVDRVAKAARTIDGTTGALRALELAAGDAGVSQDDVTNAAQRMTREIARAAREGGRGADALSRLGLEASALGDMDADKRLATISDSVRELGAFVWRDDGRSARSWRSQRGNGEPVDARRRRDPRGPARGERPGACPGRQRGAADRANERRPVPDRAGVSGVPKPACGLGRAGA